MKIIFALAVMLALTGCAGLGQCIKLGSNACGFD